MLLCWHLVWILVRTDHPCLGVGCHTANLSSPLRPSVATPTQTASPSSACPATTATSTAASSSPSTPPSSTAPWSTHAGDAESGERTRRSACGGDAARHRLVLGGEGWRAADGGDAARRWPTLRGEALSIGSCRSPS
jgi:hypothetical protein